jgi:hypothetical protein
MSATRQADEAVGRFLRIFSELDFQLGETAKGIFRITDHKAADAIVALADFTKKTNLILSAVDFAQEPGGTALGLTLPEALLATADEVIQ